MSDILYACISRVMLPNVTCKVIFDYDIHTSLDISIIHSPIGKFKEFIRKCVSIQIIVQVKYMPKYIIYIHKHTYVYESDIYVNISNF